MRKERFLVQRSSILLPKRDGPLQVLECVDDNIYKLDLSGDYNISTTFYVIDLIPFYVGDDLKENSFQEEGNDANHSTTSKNPIQLPIGPVTRARVNKFKDVLNVLIKKF